MLSAGVVIVADGATESTVAATVSAFPDLRSVPTVSSTFAAMVIGLPSSGVVRRGKGQLADVLAVVRVFSIGDVATIGPGW